MKQARELADYATKDIAGKFRTFVEDPELFSQRQNVAMLYARNAQLLEDPALDLTNSKARKSLYRGVDLLEAGDVMAGIRVIKEALQGLDSTKSAWDEFRQNANAIKDLSNAEVNRAKEMRLTLTGDQVLSMIDRLLNVVTDAIEGNVQDPVIQGRVIRTIVGGSRELIGSGAGALLQSIGNQSRGDLDQSE